MGLDFLLKKRLLIVTGKGGVGKTAVATSIALEAAEQGLHTLLIGIESGATLSHIMRPCPATEVESIPETLSCMILSRQEVLDEFVQKAVKLKAISQRILDSPIYQYVTAVAPGVRELIILNRIYEFEKLTLSFKKRTKKYDLIVVDAPAIGHGLSFLEVPTAVLKSFRVGPIKARAQRIRELLRDTTVTGIVLVTLAEEMPIAESLEFYHEAKETYVYPIVAIIVNGIYPPILPGSLTLEDAHALLANRRFSCFLRSNYPDEFLEHLERHVTFSQSRYTLNQGYAARLRTEVNQELFLVPQFATASGGRDLLDKMRTVMFTAPSAGSGRNQA